MRKANAGQTAQGCGTTDCAVAVICARQYNERMAVMITQAEKYILIFLLLAWAALLFGGFALGREQPDGTRRMPLWTRLASSFALALAGGCWWWFIRREAQSEAASALSPWTAAGMALGLLGDLFMARLIIKSDRYVLGGMGAFGLGHVAYIAGLIRAGNAAGYDDPGIRWPALAACLAVGAAAWYGVVYRGGASFARGRPGALHLAALPYALLLAATTGFALGLALQAAAFVPLALGAALFLLSDLILAAQLFNGLHFRLIGDVIWLTYGPGQMLIVYALAFDVVF